MGIKTKGKAIVDYRALVTMWLSITATIILPPFSINNFLHERYILGLGSLGVVIIMVYQAYIIWRGRRFQRVAAMVLVPAIIVFLAMAFHYQKIIGALWCYPSVLIIYFMLPRRPAIYASLALLAVAIPSALYNLELPIAARFAATLTAVVVFAAVFVLIIEQQQQELEQKESQRRDSMASASHELRTPIATMMAQIEAMRDGIRPLDQTQLGSLSHSVRHLGNLVDDLSLLSLADVNALSMVYEKVQLPDLVEEAVMAARSKMTENDLQVELSIEEVPPVGGDPRRLRQILDNLLSNCGRYTTPGGTVSIHLRAQGKNVLVTVADTGPGVSDDQLERLFDRFFRVEKSRARAQGGSGLGLSLVQALAVAQGGSVKATHADQGGLAITVSLPRLEETAG